MGKVRTNGDIEWFPTLAAYWNRLKRLGDLELTCLGCSIVPPKLRPLVLKITNKIKKVSIDLVTRS